MSAHCGGVNEMNGGGMSGHGVETSEATRGRGVTIRRGRYALNAACAPRDSTCLHSSYSPLELTASFTPQGCSHFYRLLTLYAMSPSTTHCSYKDMIVNEISLVIQNIISLKINQKSLLPG